MKLLYYWIYIVPSAITKHCHQIWFAVIAGLEYCWKGNFPLLWGLVIILQTFVFEGRCHKNQHAAPENFRCAIPLPSDFMLWGKSYLKAIENSEKRKGLLIPVNLESYQIATFLF